MRCLTFLLCINNKTCTAAYFQIQRFHKVLNKHYVKAVGNCIMCLASHCRYFELEKAKSVVIFITVVGHLPLVLLYYIEIICVYYDQPGEQPCVFSMGVRCGSCY